MKDSQDEGLRTGEVKKDTFQAALWSVKATNSTDAKKSDWETRAADHLSQLTSLIDKLETAKRLDAIHDFLAKAAFIAGFIPGCGTVASIGLTALNVGLSLARGDTAQAAQDAIGFADCVVAGHVIFLAGKLILVPATKMVVSALAKVGGKAVLAGVMKAGITPLLGAISGVIKNAAGNVPASLLRNTTGRFLSKEYSVYFGMRGGKAVYTGITRQSLAQRLAQHGDRFTSLQEVATNLTRRQARAVEQALIERNPNFENVINSISANRVWYNDVMTWGRAFLSGSGL